MPGTPGDPVRATFARPAATPAIVRTGLNVIDGGMDGTVGAIKLPIVAGPCGAMPCVIATQYRIRTVTLAKTILIRTVISPMSVRLP